MSTSHDTHDTVLDGDWDPSAWWSTTNHGEAVPGVITPMNWAFWGSIGETSTRGAFIEIGALEEDQGGVPEDPHDRVLGIFHGKVAGNVHFLGRMGDRIPGITGAIMAEGLIGKLPDDFPVHPTDERHAIIGERMPKLFAGMAEAVTTLGAQTDAWWRAKVAAAGELDLPAAQALWDEARLHFEKTVQLQIVSIFAGVQPAIHRLTVAASEAGRADLMGPLLAGQGSHAELNVVIDLWRLSRDELTLDEFLATHGYHGPMEGEMSSRVWREDPSPVTNIAAQYRDQPDDQHPLVVAKKHEAARQAAQAELLGGLTGTQRDETARIVEEADRYVPLRGVGKVSFVQTLDVARAATRRIGVLLREAGAIDEVDDVFFLVEAEVLDPDAASRRFQAVVADRQALREGYLRLSLPSAWQGRPEVVVEEAPDDDGDRTGLTLTGVAASAGVVEGPVRVVTDPAFGDVEPGEILVAPLTDPAWAPIMYCSAALVVDVGGMISHAAVIARELGLPCVMGVDGTTRLRTGDVVRVDGTAGTVEVLEPAPLGA